jgi:hypothetical protein
VRPVITLKMRQLSAIERFVHLLKPSNVGTAALGCPADCRWLRR